MFCADGVALEFSANVDREREHGDHDRALR